MSSISSDDFLYPDDEDIYIIREWLLMACANPFYLPFLDEYKRPIPGVFHQIPCGYCMSCKVDYRNQWQDRIDYDRVGNSSAFVTFTYDDYRIPFGETHNPTLRQSDVQKFIWNVRSTIRRKGVPSPLCRPDFRYYIVGEYGDKFGRPHYHAIFLGLDFYDCRSLFFNCWKNGIIDSLPILDGGVRYVLKYVDKQVHGDLAKKIFDDNFVERPFSTCSTGLGNGLFYSQIDHIREFGTYKNLAGKERPCPQYYKDLFLSSPRSCFEKKLKEYVTHTGDSKFRMFDQYQSDILSAREKTLGDLNLASGKATLRVGPAYVSGSVRSYMMSEFQKSKLRQIDTFNDEVLKIIYEHENLCA